MSEEGELVEDDGCDQRERQTQDEGCGQHDRRAHLGENVPKNGNYFHVDGVDAKAVFAYSSNEVTGKLGNARLGSFKQRFDTDKDCNRMEHDEDGEGIVKRKAFVVLEGAQQISANEGAKNAKDAQCID